MKYLLFILSLVMVAEVCCGQTSKELFKDKNPKLTVAEAEWLNSNFKTENFDFNGKYIGFIELTHAFYGIGKFTFPMFKTRLPNILLDKIDYKVVVLDSIDRIRTNGYDAILVIVSKWHKGKLKRLQHETIIYNSKNYYAQIPADAGVDSNPSLNSSNAVFFNDLYRMSRHSDTSFDFTGKKVAVFDLDDSEQRVKLISIAEYVHIVKAQLEKTGEFWLGDTYYLTDEQKRETGGYDVIIVPQTKKGESLIYLIEKLKSR